ncbi:phytanoyl-CoA dioxygenase [Dactylosporangium roseum]|uniref:Phytanoyl-CoA dioxygenase n=1 Tax=Dactylosporangium roseum TaxID=47989 RepID=A0ABY5YYD6_9ACTN|nr:phytanoyl-CoA dioxygenase [Dactylosporangium roseum]UWZ34760.1 phytanoyl-CoA dioxygenase [Dactylosporangium roseum]
MAPQTLTEEQIEDFVRDGFVRIEGAFPRELADQVRASLWKQLDMDPDDPTTWTKEVIRLGFCDEEPFVRSANTPRLYSAYDQLVGPGRWKQPTTMGTFPIRFPTKDKKPEDAEDFGWHIDAGFLAVDIGVETYKEWQGEMAVIPPNYEETFRYNVWSKGRALLMLFLYSDTGEADAPTLIRVGSHLDVPPLLEPAGREGRYLHTDDVGVDRPLASATGNAGDVYLCHPFLVHTPVANVGSKPKFMAQPNLEPVAELELDRADGRYTPLERSVRLGLGR